METPIAAAMQELAAGATPGPVLVAELDARLARRRARHRTIAVASAAVITAALVIGVGAVAARGGDPGETVAVPPSTAAPSNAEQPTSAQALTATIGGEVDPAVACASPASDLATYWLLPIRGEEGAQRYRGTVTIGTSTVPALALYIGGGPPGVGLLCVSGFPASGPGAMADPGPGVRASTTARAGAIAYAAVDPQDTLYFAVRPDVARVDVDDLSGRSARSYLPNRTGEPDRGEMELQDLGDGWHAVATGYGYSGGTQVLRAYDVNGQLLDTVTVTVASGPAPASSQPPTS